MKIKTNRDDLASALSLASRVATKRSSMEVLGCVLLETVEGGVLVQATDLAMASKRTVPAEVLGAGAVCVSAAMLRDVMKGLPSSETTIESDAEAWVTVRSGKARYRLAGRKADDFPELPNRNGMEPLVLESSLLQDLLRKTVFAISTDESRPHLNAVKLEAHGDRLRAVATDGHRLSLVERKVEGLGAVDALVQLGAVQTAIRLAGEADDVRLFLGSEHTFLVAGDTELAATRVEACFPPYEKVIPTRWERTVTVGREAILDALRRVSLVSRSDGAVLFVFDPAGSIKMSGESADIGDASETVDAEVGGRGELQLGARASYMLEALEAIDSERVELCMSGEKDAIRMVPEGKDDQIGVVMPMRL